MFGFWIIIWINLNEKLFKGINRIKYFLTGLEILQFTKIYLRKQCENLYLIDLKNFSVGVSYCVCLLEQYGCHKQLTVMLLWLPIDSKLGVH